jgi:hypothetical protein
MEDFTEGTWWGGRSVAFKMAEVVPRGRLIVTGTISAADVVTIGGVASYRCGLDDGTGQLDVIFLGRRHVSGLDVDTRCTVEGTARSEGDRLVVWNPLYRFEVLDFPWD